MVEILSPEEITAYLEKIQKTPSTSLFSNNAPYSSPMTPSTLQIRSKLLATSKPFSPTEFLTSSSPYLSDGSTKNDILSTPSSGRSENTSPSFVSPIIKRKDEKREIDFMTQLTFIDKRQPFGDKKQSEINAAARRASSLYRPVIISSTSFSENGSPIQATTPGKTALYKHSALQINVYDEVTKEKNDYRILLSKESTNFDCPQPDLNKKEINELHSRYRHSNPYKKSGRIRIDADILTQNKENDPSNNSDKMRGTAASYLKKYKATNPQENSIEWLHLLPHRVGGRSDFTNLVVGTKGSNLATELFEIAAYRLVEKNNVPVEIEVEAKLQPLDAKNPNLGYSHITSEIVFKIHANKKTLTVNVNPWCDLIINNNEHKKIISTVVDFLLNNKPTPSLLLKKPDTKFSDFFKDDPDENLINRANQILKANV